MKRQIPNVALTLGAAALAAAALLIAVLPDVFLRPWLAMAHMALGLGIGATVLMQVWLMAGGRWLPPMAPALRLLARLTPLTLLLFVPVILRPALVAYWLDAPARELEEIVEKRGAYATSWALLARSVLYALVFTLVPLATARRVRRVLHEDGAKGGIAAPGMVLLALGIYFFAIDWMMALQPQWYSTLFPFLLFISDTVAALAVACLFLAALPGEQPVVRLFAANLLLAATCLWVYLGLMQFLIIWMGNLPPETPWYLERSGTLGTGMTLAILFLGAALPFFLLLPRSLRQRRGPLALAAAGALTGQAAYVLWIVSPSRSGEALAGSLFMTALLLLLAGLIRNRPAQNPVP